MGFQTTVEKYADQLGPAGSRVGGGHLVERGYSNDRSNVPKVVDITPTAQDSTAYQFEVDGVPIGFTSDASGTQAEIRDGLLAALAVAAAAFPNGAVAKLVGSASGVDVRLTESKPEDGEVSITESDANLALAVVTAHAQEEPVDAGIMMVRGPTSRSARLPSGTSVEADFIGIVEHRHRGADLLNLANTNQYEPKSQIPIGYRGEWVVLSETAVALSDGVFVRIAAGPGGTQLGALRNDNDGGAAIQLTKARWRSAVGAAGKVRVALDLI